MNSYQRLKARADKLEDENNTLRKELLAKGNVFFAKCVGLGVGELRLGTVIDGHNVYLAKQAPVFNDK